MFFPCVRIFCSHAGMLTIRRCKGIFKAKWTPTQVGTEIVHLPSMYIVQCTYTVKHIIIQSVNHKNNFSNVCEFEKIIAISTHPH